jgi:hypothetical protein
LRKSPNEVIRFQHDIDFCGHLDYDDCAPDHCDSNKVADNPDDCVSYKFCRISINKLFRTVRIPGISGCPGFAGCPEFAGFNTYPDVRILPDVRQNTGCLIFLRGREVLLGQNQEPGSFYKTLLWNWQSPA